MLLMVLAPRLISAIGKTVPEVVIGLSPIPAFIPVSTVALLFTSKSITSINMTGMALSMYFMKDSKRSMLAAGPLTKKLFNYLSILISRSFFISSGIMDNIDSEGLLLLLLPVL